MRNENRLTEVTDWDVWNGQPIPDADAVEAIRPHNVETWLDVIPGHVPVMPGGRVLEVGCAPGVFAVRLARLLHCTPFGVEYAPSGVKATRQFFKKVGENEDHIIHNDFFSDHFLRQHLEQFDVVVSMGFIEHFRDPANVVSRHVDLVKPGGYLIVSIPNFLGMYRYIGEFCVPNVASTHNLDLMRADAFLKACSDPRLCTAYCGYVGTLHFIFDPQPSGLKALIRWFLANTEVCVHRALGWLYGRARANSAFFSPYLIYIGQRSRQPG